ncbi:adenylosuccinate lyase family protein [Microbacterium sp. HD4P20]|uniref:lyase family protein n=1 Tax=Microbacterium sp. HD4P20 TaxID=2864874 RepID=UPI0020A281E2|nr:adenylosuccinate lyase family protein [Microbacterium sp. HD4P20]MCP2638419.1 adenylosuccinate lyase family protein [Microbacterium sp. HD4P20]
MTSDPRAMRTIADVAGAAERFTDYSVADAGIRDVYATSRVWQTWIDVEVALAAAEADEGIVPRSAADRIASVGDLERMERDRIVEGMRRQGHPLVPIIEELARAAGPDAGGWVHWGATSQNIMQSGNAVLLHRAHGIVGSLLRECLAALAELADRSADMIMPGRTHGQHAVPITFGLKAATWADDLLHGRDRLDRGVEPCLRVMMAGAVGSFASLGEQGPRVQEGVATRLGLGAMAVPSRALLSPQAGYISDMALVAASCARIALDIETMMQTEFGEVSEPVPEGSVGSSTMPHKRNPKLSSDVIDLAARLRALAPEAMGAVIHPHEADGGSTAKLDSAIQSALVGMGDLLVRLRTILTGLELFPERMRRNLELSGELLASEAVMLALGERIGRDEAHHIVYVLAMRAATEGADFADLLLGEERVTASLSPSRIRTLLDPAAHTGLSAQMARETAQRVRDTL